MRRIISSFAAIFLFVAVASPTSVVAQQDVVEATAEQTTVEDAAGLVEQDATAADKEAARAARIEERKQKVTDRLTAAQERVLANACKGAQAKVTSVKAQYDAAVQKRTGVYERVTSRLDTLVEKLQAASVDTTALEAVIVEFDSLVTASVAALEQYGQALDDLASMDCEADPEGFQATLSTARELRSEAITQSSAVKSYAQNEMKAALQAIRGELSSDSTNEEEPDTVESES